ncbi:MAG: ComF family protein [Desulfomonile sp.]|nr:ComF family protein [Desulfomonile sp.]
MGFKLQLTALMRAVADLILPRTCSFCESAAPLESNEVLCSACRGALREIAPPLCQKCGLPVQTLLPDGPEFCGRCLSSSPVFGAARYGFSYEESLRLAILRFKFYGGLSLGSALASLLTEAFDRHFNRQAYDVIVPMPIHPRRLIERGFNQAVILAEGLSAAIGIPVDRTSFCKIKDTPPQVGLTEAQRAANLRGSFAVSRPERLKGRRVLLVDDVCTTGSTIAYAAQTISKTAPARVDVLALALRLPSGGDGTVTAGDTTNDHVA